VLQSKAYVDQHLVDDVDLSFAATTFSDDDSADGLEGADNEAAGAGALSEPSSPTPETTASSFQSHRSKPQLVIAGPAIPKHVDDGRYRSGSQNSPSGAYSLHSLSLHSQSSLSVASPVSSLTPSLTPSLSSSSSSHRSRTGSRSRTRPRSRSKPQEPDFKKIFAASSIIVMKNLPFTLTPEDLEARLASLSAKAVPVRVQLQEKKGTGTFSGMAFAHYASVDLAKEAFGKMSHGFEVEGRKVRVEFKRCSGSSGSGLRPAGTPGGAGPGSAPGDSGGVSMGMSSSVGGSIIFGAAAAASSSSSAEKEGSGNSSSSDEARAKSPVQATSGMIVQFLQQFMESSSETVFDFPANCNSAMRKMIHASAKSLGLEHATTSCSNGTKFVRVYKKGAFENQHTQGLDAEWALLSPTPPPSLNHSSSTGGGGSRSSGNGGSGGTPRSLLQTPLSTSSSAKSLHAMSAPGAGASGSLRGGHRGGTGGGGSRGMGAARNLNFGSRPHKHPAVSTGFRPRASTDAVRERSNSGRGTPPFVLRQPKGPTSAGGRGFSSVAGGGRPRTKSASSLLGSPPSPLQSSVFRPKAVAPVVRLLMDSPSPDSASSTSASASAIAAQTSPATVVGAGSTSATPL